MLLFEIFFRKLPGGAAEKGSCGGPRKKSRQFEDSTEGAALGTLETRLNGDKAQQFGLYLQTDLLLVLLRKFPISKAAQPKEKVAVVSEKSRKVRRFSPKKPCRRRKI
jgi:hypothetical protein